jgi:hypothetical protein
MSKSLYILFFMSFAFINTANAESALFTGRGAALCSQFTSEVSENKQYEYIYFSWAQGYMSASNLRHHENSNTSINLEPSSMGGRQQLDYLRAYCALNQEKYFVVAVGVLFNELRNK